MESNNKDDMEIGEPGDFLREELTKRISKNSKYSLRAFAKALRVSPATLSLVISGKSPLTQKILRHITQNLNLSPEQSFHFEKQVLRRKQPYLMPATVKESNVRNVTLEIFKVLSEWYYYSILSLLELKNSSADPKWISQKLGISVFEAKEAVDRLKKLNFISKQNGKWKQSSAQLRIDDSSTISAARRFQKQLLLKAIESLENMPTTRRDFSSMTFTMSSKDISYAAEKIADFRREITKDLEKRKSIDSVYNLTIQLFPTTMEQK